MAAPRYNVFVGAETGLLKAVNSEKRAFVNLNSVHEVNRDNEITAMCWNDSEETELLVGLRSQIIKAYKVDSGLCTDSYEVRGGTGPFKGLAKYEDKFITCTSSGFLKVWSDDTDQQVEINAGDAIYKMRQNPQQPWLLATGGRENDLKVWNLLEPSEPVFKAKNVRNDFLDLRVPVWVTDMQFIPGSEKIVTCTGHHQIRVYDPSTPQKRPVINMEFEEYPLTALTLTHSNEQVVVGNSIGRMALMDLRKQSVVHVYKGCIAGSIRSVCCHPRLPLIASCGLDRFLRIHDVNTRKLLNKMYLKSRLNCVLLRTDFEIPDDQPASSIVSPEEQEEENLWDAMESIDDRLPSVKRKAETNLKKVKKKNKSKQL